VIDFGHLTPTEFEALCFELLTDLGAESVDWRKGSVGDASPSDQGRDIECTFRFRGPAGEVLSERRFVECKHYAHGIPPRALQGALAWAVAERPDALYFLASGFLSNPAKQYLQDLQRNNRPPFRIVVWEQPDLARLLSTRGMLLRKYALTGPEAHLRILHPEHSRFIQRAPLLGLSSLFRVLDALQSDERSEFLQWVQPFFGDVRLRRPRTGNESLRELMVREFTYEDFREKCLALPVGEHFLASAIVQVSLAQFFAIADTTRTDGVRAHHEDFIAFIESRQRAGSTKDLTTLIEHQRQLLAGVEDRLKQNYESYSRFCERLLKPLMDAPREPLVLPDELKRFAPDLD
jgi:hypothetical protein